MALTGRYIYCFIREKEKINICGSNMANTVAPVYTIPCGDISAVVSDTGVFEYDPTRRNVIAHQRVVTKVMENYTVIPVAFGTVGNSKSEIEKIIAGNLDELRSQLDFFTGKSELGLRATWDEGYFNRDIEDDDIRELKEKVSGRKEDEVLPQKIELGRLVERAILAKKDEYAGLIYEPLSKKAVRSKLRDGIPIKTVFNAYFLIDNRESEEFDKLVEKLTKPYEGKIVFSYTGPWPPYNFVDVKLNLNTESGG